jgi:hypothetical protein
MVPLVYHPRYNITAFGLERLHPFDGRKYRRIHDALIARGLVVDLDAHQGNGTAAVFSGRDWEFIYDLYEADRFPARKVPEDYPRPVGPGLAGGEYLGIVRDTLPGALDAVRPDLVVYNAGSDPFVGDPLARLRLTAGDLAERDLIASSKAEPGTSTPAILSSIPRTRPIHSRLAQSGRCTRSWANGSSGRIVSAGTVPSSAITRRAARATSTRSGSSGISHPAKNSSSPMGGHSRHREAASQVALRCRTSKMVKQVAMAIEVNASRRTFWTSLIVGTHRRSRGGRAIGPALMIP